MELSSLDSIELAYFINKSTVIIYPAIDEEELEEGSMADFLASRAALASPAPASSHLFLVSDWRLCFMRRFWNQTLT